MVKQSPHRRWKGNRCMCKCWKHKGNGDAERTPWATLRKLGKRRRFSRKGAYDAGESDR